MSTKQYLWGGAVSPEIEGTTANKFCFRLYGCSTEQHTVAFSQSSLIQLVGPSECTLHDYISGGESPDSISTLMLDFYHTQVGTLHSNVSVREN